MDKRDSIKTCMKDLKFMTLEDRIVFRITTMMYKTMNSLAPPYLKIMFQQINSVHTRKTRSSVKNNLYIPKANKCVFRNSFAIHHFMVNDAIFVRGHICPLNTMGAATENNITDMELL